MGGVFYIELCVHEEFIFNLYDRYMGLELYERPREKLRNRGVGALSDTELLQLIIASGSKKVSAARIAKNVVSVLQRGRGLLTYEHLTSIAGLGDAKACQVIAALELGRRNHGSREVDSAKGYPAGVLALSQHKGLSMYSAVLDGQGKALQEDTIKIHGNASLIIRHIFASAIEANAYEIMIAFGCSGQEIESLDTTLLAMVRKVFDTATLLELRITEIFVVGQAGVRKIRRKEVG